MLEYQVGLFFIRGAEGDMQVLKDVGQALQEQGPQVCKMLEYDCRKAIQVDIFPDQASLDMYGMNPDMKGYYAYSGDGRIQMVSPRNPLPQNDPGYSQRVLIAVHEFVHLVNNGINPEMPTWLNEGTAIYVGPHDLYDFVCQNGFPFDRIPDLGKMEQAYESVPAADLFAYSMVDYIATEFGQEILNRLLVNPESFEELLGMKRSVFQQGWLDFIQRNYTVRDAGDPEIERRWKSA